MAFGFGFNKAKVTASAERNVKAGKLQNAIADYEKIAKEDPRDLNVLNTIGDLYVRVGNNDQATGYYKRVADAYAADGFTVKAIAMYKKLTKLSPSPESVVKLAELYVQQGLYNEARVQYMVIAEQMVRSGDMQRAADIFQKVLDLDPDNSQMQGRMADVLVKLGRKTEARDIYFRNAELFRSRGQAKEADEALAKAIAIDSGFVQALLLRGHVKLDLGDAAGAVQSLEKIADIDSRPEGLRTLLKAELKLGNLETAAPLAQKLLTVSGEVTGIVAFAEALIGAGRHASAIRIFAENAEAVLKASPDHIDVLTTAIGYVKQDAAALEMLSMLLQKAGRTAHVAEVRELLAHALVQAGELAQARDLYRELMDLEPENPLHTQNYRQVLARLGQDLNSQPIAPGSTIEELIIEEMEAKAPHIAPEYPPEVAELVKSALTDAELFDSYNLPEKAIAPLERVLPRVPRDPQLHQRLATLYARAFRWSDAARSCRVLAELYSEAGFADQACECASFATKYDAQAARGSVRAATAFPGYEESVFEVADKVPASVEEGSAVASPAAMGIDELIAGDGTVSSLDLSAFAEPTLELTPAPAIRSHEPMEAAASGANVAAFDEFLQTFQIDSSAVPPVTETVVSAPELETWGTPEPPAPAASVPSEAPAEFDASEWEGMLEVESVATPQAVAETAAPVSAGEDAIWEMLGTKPLTETDEPASVARCESDELVIGDELADTVEEFRFYLSQGMIEGANAALTRIHALDPQKADELRPELRAAAGEPITAEASVEVVAAGNSVAAEPPDVAAEADLLGSLVLDLEDSLGDFVEAPKPKAAAASATPVAPPAPVAASAPAIAHVVTPSPAVPTSAASALAPQVEDEFGGALADVFADFKQDMEADTATSITEDPETHYNLGVAFKEMGLLDEAIGELQKVCTAIDRGSPFPQVLQAYTWLADCFVQKGVPEAAVRWYEKALRYPHLDAESAVAIHYELGSACEAAGDRAAALRHFMEVFGANIDYRDVADRIQQLKS